MKYRPRIYYTDAQKELMWDRWQKASNTRLTISPNSAIPTRNIKGAAHDFFKTSVGLNELAK